MWERIGKTCPTGETGFVDVDPDGVHTPGIECLKGVGITKGATATTFKPSANISISQLSTFAMRFWDAATGKDCPSNSLVIGFIDPLYSEGTISETHIEGVRCAGSLVIELALGPKATITDPEDLSTALVELQATVFNSDATRAYMALVLAGIWVNLTP